MYYFLKIHFCLADTVHYFLCLIRHGAQVIVTQMISTDERSKDGILSFTNHIQLRNLPADFSVVFEVYALVSVNIIKLVLSKTLPFRHLQFSVFILFCFLFVANKKGQFAT